MEPLVDPNNGSDWSYCRFCGNKKYKVEVFDFGRTMKCLINYIEKLRYMNLYMDFTGNLPTYICSICFNEFNRYFDFVKQLNEAQESLKMIFTNNNNNNIVQAECSQIEEADTGDLPLQIRKVDDEQIEEQREENEVIGQNNETDRPEGYKVHNEDENDGGDGYNSHVESDENESSGEEVGSVTHKEEETDENGSQSDGDSGSSECEENKSSVEEDSFHSVTHKEDDPRQGETDKDEFSGHSVFSKEIDNETINSSESEDIELTRKEEGRDDKEDDEQRDNEIFDCDNSSENDQETAEEEGQEDGSKTEKKTGKDTDISSNDTPDRPLREVLGLESPEPIPERPEPITNYQNEVTENQPSTSRLIMKRRSEGTQDGPLSQRSKFEEERNKSWSSYTWTCCHCDNQYTTLRALRIHSKEVHRICFGFECPECDAEHYKFEEFVEHMRDHWYNLRYYCPICDKRFNRISECNAHYETHPKSSACRYCGEILPTTSVVALHHSIYNKRIIQAELDYVPMEIAVIEGTAEHITFDNYNYSWRQYRWTCRLCGVVYTNMQALRDHGIAVHRNCFTVKCRDCNAVPTSFLAFIVHVCMHRPDLKVSCPYCYMLVASTFLLGEHLHSHLGYPINACAACGQTFQNDIEKAYHYRNNDVRKQTTNLPPINGDMLVNFSKQLLSIDYDDSYFPCSLCEYRFSNEESLIEHNELKKCDFCELLFFCFFKFRQHLFTVHFAHKPYYCLKCGRSFRFSESAINHIVIHANEELETCRFCCDKFTRKFFKQHIKTHDKGSDVKQSLCRNCNLRLPSFSDLVHHVQTNHNRFFSRQKIILADYIKSATYRRQLALMERED